MNGTLWIHLHIEESVYITIWDVYFLFASFAVTDANSTEQLIVTGLSVSALWLSPPASFITETLWSVVNCQQREKKHKNREQRKGSVAPYFACFPCSHGKINSPDVERVKLGSHQKEDFLSEGTRNGWRVRDALWVKAINRPENMYKSKWKDIKPSGVTSLFPRARRILESTDQTVGIESLPAVCAELWPENLKKTEKRCFSSNVLVIWLRFPPKSCLPASRQCNSPTLQKSWSKSHSAGMTW